MIPVVLLHALGLDATMWTDQRHALREIGHPVVAFDQPDYGAAPPSLDVVVEDLARTLDERGIDEIALAGSSMGGYVAMAFLRRFPWRVRALALLATRAEADDPDTAAGRLRFADLVVDSAAREAILAATTPKLVGATTRARRPEVVTRLRAITEAIPPGSLAWSQRAIAGREDSFDVLCAADIPSVVIAGDEDELVSIVEAERMAKALPDAEFVVIPDAGHLTPMETPDAVTAALGGLLRRAA